MASSRPLVLRLFSRSGIAALALAFLVVPAAGAQDEDDPADLGLGMEIWNGGCSGCHQTDGSGSSAGRSLIDVALEEPDRSVHVASVTNGIGNMPGYEGRLTEDEIDAVVSYVRLTFRSEEAPMEELPRTGVESWLFVTGFSLIAVGAGALSIAAPAQRRRVVSRG